MTDDRETLFPFEHRRRYLGPNPHQYTFVMPGDELAALLDVVEAAHRANVSDDCGCDKTPCPNERLLGALARFDFGATK